MNKNNKTWLIIGGLLTLAGLVYVYIKRKKYTPFKLPALSDENCTTFPLKLGSGIKTCEKSVVRLIQIWINSLDYLANVDESGYFDKLTEETLFYYTGQKTVDQTWYEEMKAELQNPILPSGALTDIQAKMIAEDMFNAMLSTGTDEDALFAAVEPLNSEGLTKVILAFGVRPYFLTGYNMGMGTHKTLQGWLKAELGGQDLATMQELFITKGILF